MSYQRLMSENDMIARLCRDLLSELDAEDSALESLQAGFSQLSIAIESLACFELENLYPRLLAIDGAFAEHTAARFRDEVETIRNAKASFMAEWCAECIRADPDEFRAEARAFLNQVLQQTATGARTIYAFALKVGALSLRD